MRTEQEQKEATDIFTSFRNESLKRQLSNTENYDKSILTLSSTGLAVSLTLLNIIHLNTACYSWLLPLSWWLFLTCIALSLIAYQVSNLALNRQLDIAERYYINQEEEAFHQRNRFSEFNDRLNSVVGIVFICALSAIVVFFSLNLPHQRENMSNDDLKTSVEPLTKSATVPNMQRLPTGAEIGINSAQVPTMQSIPKPPPPPQQTSQGSGQNQKSEN